MRPLSRQISSSTILRVLFAGFGLVFILLAFAGFFGIRGIRSIQQNAMTLVEEQRETAQLIEEIQSQQEALSTIFSGMARPPKQVDRTRILEQLEESEQTVEGIVARTRETEEAELGRRLKQAMERFTAEARRLLTRKRAPMLLSRDLFEHHLEATEAIVGLVDSGYKRSQAAQQTITAQSRQLLARSLGLLGACLLSALFVGIATVKLTGRLIQTMQWQTSELSRVSWYLLENQESVARRFSHELHDELGQALTALKAGLMALARPGASDGRLQDCLELVDGAIRSVRELSHLLRPTILDDFGLDASLRWLAEKFTQRTGIAVDYRSNFTGRLSDETETHLFRIAQEALTNVARHARARRVEISLEAGRSGWIELSIADDGVGLSAGALEERKGMGMIGMRARARSAGGELNVSSRSGQGVTVRARVPARRVSHVEEDSGPARG